MNQTNKVFYTLVAIFLSCSIEMAGQVQKVISGTVTELFGKTAEPLVGVNVNLVNNQNRSLGGGITNLNGQYNVKVPEGEKDLTIVYSYIGMKTKRIKYTGQTLLNVTLESESMAVDEVVVSARRLNRNDLGISDKEMVSATQKVDMEKLIALKRETVGADFQKIDYFREILFDEAATPVPEVEESSLTAGMQYLP